jgi:hypothetical protein
MIIESGIVVFLGFLFLFWKLPRHTILHALGYPLALDIAGSVLAYVLHWGTFTGVMAAAVAGMMLSGMTSAARWAVGYVDKGLYYPGHIANWSVHLKGQR